MSKLGTHGDGKTGCWPQLSRREPGRGKPLADLRKADLRGADLSYANLRGADLSRANLRGADLLWASVAGANLTQANLSHADLGGTGLSEALARPDSEQRCNESNARRQA